MASLWQKTMFYLGLVDDEQIEAAEAAPEDLQPGVRTVEAPPPETGGPRRVKPSIGSGSVVGRRVEPPAPVRRRVSDNAEHAEAGVLVTATGRRAPRRETESAIIEARTLSDAQTLSAAAARSCSISGTRSRRWCDAWSISPAASPMRSTAGW
jgi:hypothetical protein